MIVIIETFIPSDKPYILGRQKYCATQRNNTNITYDYRDFVAFIREHAWGLGWPALSNWVYELCGANFAIYISVRILGMFMKKNATLCALPLFYMFHFESPAWTYSAPSSHNISPTHRTDASKSILQNVWVVFLGASCAFGNRQSNELRLIASLFLSRPCSQRLYDSDYTGVLKCTHSDMCMNRCHSRIINISACRRFLDRREICKADDKLGFLASSQLVRAHVAPNMQNPEMK